ncbi:MAG TPA: type II toxin-antitoxin system HicB family antitoxin [Thermoanaerobaculia bacterium]|nr:type II toxin-antitoxin system HicB family antitoxin [Thermoanaerobaculia bacterium]
MKTLTYRIHLTPEPEGGYTVTAPALQGCVTWGRDYEHAVERAHEAIELYLSSLADDGLPIPEDTLSADAFVQIQAPAAWSTSGASPRSK